VDISLITSLYHAEPFLATYTRYVLDVAAQVMAAGLSLEIVLIANDASEEERRQIDQLMEAAQTAGTVSIVPLFVPHDTVYASWNQGIQVAGGECIGVWNVDDVREAGALIEGFQAIQAGCSLVYFPYYVIKYRRWFGLFRTRHTVFNPVRPFNRIEFTSVFRTGTFYLFKRSFYDQVGPFDAHFRISGDFDWIIRAAQVTDFCRGTMSGGRFALHGGNLSDTGNPLQGVEENIVHLRQRAWHNLKPVDPHLMRSAWEEWGSQGHTIPADIEQQLWGKNAFEIWQQWKHQQRRKRQRTKISEILRAFPRFVINRTGLRPIMARMGIVKSAVVDR
jgi:hypothetical protein